MAEYRGLFGAFRFAFRQSGSWLFRSYVLASAVVGAYVAVIILLGVVTWIANPTGVIGELSLLGVAAMAILAPLFAPVLVVARRRRYGDDRPRVELAIALAGYGFLGGTVLGLLISDPRSHGTAWGLAGLDALPAVAGAVPPIVAAVVLAGVIWHTR